MTQSYINLWTSKDKVLGSRRDANGKLTIETVGPARYTGYVKRGTIVDPADYLFRKDDYPGWEELTFHDYETRKEALKKYGQQIFEGDISPVRRLLADRDIGIAAPRRAFLDLETDSRVPPREQVETGRGRILSWAVVDSKHTVYSGLLEDDDDMAETDLLGRLWAVMAEYDQVAAWNGDGFDFPIIEIRSQKLLGGTHRGKVFWENRRRILFVDHMALFKRHHMAPGSGDEKTSMKLNDVCQSLISEGKTEFDARKTWEAWAAGGDRRREMLEYNIQDTALLPKLEEETGYLELQQTIAEVTFTPVNSHGLKPMPWVDGFMLRLARQQKTHLPSKKPPTGDEEQYEGAYVMLPTKIGVHENVHVCDFASLYPTVIRSLNLSFETKDQLGCIAFGTGVSFGQDEEGMAPRTCRELMQQRDVWKKKAKADPDDKYAERMNKAFKITCNAFYGVLGSVYSRFYDVQIAESVTLGAQALIRRTKTHAESIGYDVIYIDTDSLFVKGGTVDEFKNFVDDCNRDLYPQMLKDIGCNPAFHCIRLDYEKCFRRLVFPLGATGVPSAKRYCASFLHYNFHPKTAPEIKGLEYMRGDGIRLARRAQKECIDKILAGEPGDELERWVLDLRQRVMTELLELEDIQLQKGLGRDLDSYKSEPGHVRLARELLDNGEDIGAGSRIAYVIADGTVSPMKIIAAQNYDGTFDRYHVWLKMIYPCLMRVLAGAFPDRNWRRHVGRRPQKVLPGQQSLFSHA